MMSTAKKNDAADRNLDLAVEMFHLDLDDLPTSSDNPGALRKSKFPENPCSNELERAVE